MFGTWHMDRHSFALLVSRHCAYVVLLNTGIPLQLISDSAHGWSLTAGMKCLLVKRI